MASPLAYDTIESSTISAKSSGKDKIGGCWEVLSKLRLHIEEGY